MVSVSQIWWLFLKSFELHKIDEDEKEKSFLKKYSSLLSIKENINILIYDSSLTLTQKYLILKDLIEKTK